jgi:DNA-binding response OmpR family regulator
MRVLQVEDDPVTARAVEQMMKSKGYACWTTAYGEEAVELATDTDFDLILLDIMLPDIGGYEVLRRLRAARVGTPVLIQSGIVGGDEVAKRAEFGIDDYLVKPFGRNDLDQHIDAVMARVGQTATAASGRPDSYGRRDDSRDDAAARRNHPRIRTLKGGQISYNDNNANCVAECLILNLSDGGASLQATDAIDLPIHVTLKTKQGKNYKCEVCWRHGKKLGVRFI